MTDRGRPELSYRERVTRYRGLGRVQQLVDAMSQSKTVGDEAESVFVDAHRADLLHSRGTALGAAAAVGLGGRLEGTPITADAVAPYCDPSADEIRTARRAFARELDLQFRHPIDHLHQLGEAFDLDDGTLDEAASLIDRAAEQGLTDNKSPEGVAAGALLHATGELGITSVGETTKVSTATIRKRRDEMQERFEMGTRELVAGFVHRRSGIRGVTSRNPAIALTEIPRLSSFVSPEYFTALGSVRRSRSERLSVGPGWPNA